jgi:hypothetical protein
MSLKQVQSSPVLTLRRHVLQATSLTQCSLQEIETWVAALGRYDNNEFEEALNEFNKIGDTSKILFNMGVIHATLGEHEKAVSYIRSFAHDIPA